MSDNVKVFGNGDIPIIFAHGFGCDQNMWRFITPASENEFKIILFDYVGSGNSDISAYKSERYKNLKGYAQDVLDIIHALELDDVILVGYSVSSMIGALASIWRPQSFKSLIMVGPSPCYLNEPPDYHGGFEHSTVMELLDLMDTILDKLPCGYLEFNDEGILNRVNNRFCEMEGLKFAVLWFGCSVALNMKAEFYTIKRKLKKPAMKERSFSR